ncbi:MAG TPA: hypothetical protein VJ579_02420 [Candidatus Paceibacterota bacterium]|nr:hypothetical protein [Candidatus Paceibacterota bacterium]
MNENANDNGFSFSWKKLKKWVYGAIAIIALLLSYSCVNDTYNESVPQETALSALFLSNQNELSSYVSGFYEQAGIANMKSDKMTKFMTDAVTGRYDKEGGGFDGSAMVSMIKEAYPGTNEFGIYDKILPFVKAGREAFKGKQDYLLDQIRTYNNWRRKGFARAYILKYFFPTNNLQARIGDKVYYGKEALEKMERIILDSQTKKAYETGVMDPLQMPK